MTLLKFILFIFLFGFINIAYSQIRGPRHYQDFNGLSNEHYQPNQLLIKWTNKGKLIQSESKNKNELNLPALNKIISPHAIKTIEYVSDYLSNQQYSIKHKKWEMDKWCLVIFDENVLVLDLINQIQKHTDFIEIIEPVLKIEQQAWIPNDPLLGSQWHYNNLGTHGGIIDADIDLPEAWEIEKGKPNIIVSVVDGGLDTNHIDLTQNLWSNEIEKFGFNFQTNSSIIEPNNHGCHVAGTIGAVNNNGIGVAGVAGGNGSPESGIRVMNCQIFSPTNQSASTMAVASSYLYSADRGAAISNNSWGYTSPQRYYNTIIFDAIDYFIENGGGPLDKGIVVFAAGNSNNEYGFYPADYERVVSVMATLNTNLKAPYSNYGYQVDVSAPGGFNSGGAVRSVYSLRPGNLYSYLHGTSMAAPHVSGVFALLASYAQDKLSSDDLRSILLTQTDNLEMLNPAYLNKMGRGGLNAYKSLSKAQDLLNFEEVEPAKNFVVEKTTCNNYKLEWNKNSDNDTVLIAVSNRHKALFGIPNGNYTIGDTIPGGGTIIYKGISEEFDFNYVGDISNYLGFKIWSKNEINVYSKGLFRFMNSVACDTLSNKVRYVKEGGTGNGSSWENASGDLQDMINKSQWGDSIFVAKGIYFPNRSYSNPFVINEGRRENTFFIDKGIFIFGGFPDNDDEAQFEDRNNDLYETILSGDVGIENDTIDNCLQVMHIAARADSILTIDGFTITAGNTPSNNVNYGAGLTNYGNIVINNIIIKNNYSRLAAGLFNAGSIKGENIKFIENIATHDGGALLNYGEIQIKNSIFHSNKASKGGAIFNYGIFHNERCEFVNNQAEQGGVILNNYHYFSNNTNYFSNIGVQGGCIYNNDSLVIISGKAHNNYADQGGYIFQKKGTSIMFNNIIDSNIANTAPVLYMDTGSSQFINSNLVRNVFLGDSIKNWVYSHNGIGYINNCLLHSNWSDTSTSFMGGDWNINYSFLDTVMIYNEDSTEIWGEIFTYENIDFIPEICSPLIDKGNNDFIPEFIINDFNNQPRIQNNFVDIGAHEYSKAKLHNIPSTEFISDVQCLKFDNWNLHMYKDSNIVIGANNSDNLAPEEINFKSTLLSSYGEGSSITIIHPNIENIQYKCSNRGWNITLATEENDSIAVKLFISEKDLSDLEIHTSEDWEQIKILLNDSIDPWNENGLKEIELTYSHLLTAETFTLDTINNWIAIEMLISKNSNIILAKKEILPDNDTVVFDGTKIDNEHVRLFWTIDNDEHLDSYRLLKKNDKEDWHSICEIAADLSNEYSFIDTLLVEGPNLYQLEIRNKIGEIFLTNILTFNYEIFMAEEYLIYPNPASNELNIKIKNPDSEHNNFILLDAIGKLYLSKNLKEKSQKISLQNLAPGVYFYQLQLSEKKYFGKIVIK